MEKKIFHFSDTGKKEQLVDTEKSSITLCDCDYCHIKIPIDHNDGRVKLNDELSMEEIMDELGFILP
jgi:hypothetical protein